MIFCKRHNLDLSYFGKFVVAPRFFKFDNYIYFVHISKDCSFVTLYLGCCSDLLSIVQVVFYNRYKVYSNSNGLFFNFRHYYKKNERIFLCD